MSNRILIVLLSIMSYIPVKAGEGEYAVLKIAPSLLKNANAVIRLEELRFEIINSGKAVYKNHYVVTILNENGDGWADFSEYYDKFRKIESVEGILYNAEGKLLKKVKTKDIQDLGGVSESSLIDDNRLKHHNFYHRVYPYTIEYIVEIDYSSTLFFPVWLPQPREKVSVEKSSVCFVAAPGYPFRYKAFNYSSDPVKTTERDKSCSWWSVKEMPALIRESYSPLWHELTTMVMFGPADFQVDDYKGNMNSWADFGKFVHALKAGKDVLPDATKEKVRQLVGSETNEKKKISLLYDYLQKNTRYISIQLGIGGWQPFDAKFVATKAYGDCKALTNFMYALLKEAGIHSYYALIRAGANEGSIIPDFPAQQFNHVILCVPLAGDTTWLECTSQTLPAGYLGDFTCDRYALLVDETGGKLVRTPVYGINDNQQQRRVQAVLNYEGMLNMDVTTRYTGLQQDNIHGLINNLSRDKIKEYLHEQLDFATYDILDFNYSEKKQALPFIDETLKMTVSNYATITGKRLFIMPNVMTRNNRKLAADEDRKQDIVFNVEYRDVDSVEISLPEGYKAESVPQDVNITSKFGNYKASVKLLANKLIYHRFLERHRGHYPAKDYSELVKFFETTYKADRNKVVLVKEEGTKGF